MNIQTKLPQILIFRYSRWKVEDSDKYLN